MKAKLKILQSDFYHSFDLYFKIDNDKFFRLYGDISIDNTFKHIEFQLIENWYDYELSYEIDIPEEFIKKILLYIFENYDTKIGNYYFLITINEYDNKNKKRYIKGLMILNFIKMLYNLFGYRIKYEYLINLKPRAKVNLEFYGRNGVKTTLFSKSKKFKNIDSCNKFIEKLKKENELMPKKIVPYQILKFKKICC